MQVTQVLVDIGSIGKRFVDIVEVTDDELCPIDELVKLLRRIAHRLAIGIIEGEHHLDVGCRHRACQLGEQFVNRRHMGQQMRNRLALGRADQRPLEVMGEKLTAATVGKDKAVILKTLSLKIILHYLLKKRNHIGHWWLDVS